MIFTLLPIWPRSGILLSMSVLIELAYFLLHFLVREILHHEGCQLAVQIAEEDYVAFAHLVEYAHKIYLRRK